MIGPERARVVKFKMDMLMGLEVTPPIVPTDLQNALISDVKEFQRARVRMMRRWKRK